MGMEMTKPNIKQALGIKTDAELAAIFNICNQAVHLWGDEKEIPIRRQLELRLAYPRLFKTEAPKIRVNRK